MTSTITPRRSFTSILFVALASLVLFSLPHSASAGFCPSLSRDLHRGLSGSDVADLQQFLVSQNLLSGEMVTGYFGSLTQGAVQQFQSMHGIPSTGYVGPLTRAAIADVCRGGSTPGPIPGSVTMTASPVSGTAPLSVTFTLNASANVCNSYILDYGDGQTENLSTLCGTRTFTHSYTAQGSYLAHLDQYVNSNGQLLRQLQAQQSISVGASITVAPTCTISANRTSITPNQAVTFTWSSTNATSATWGDGSSTGTSGSATFTDITTTTTKSINFTGPGGSRSCSSTITVTAATTSTSVGVSITGNAIANGGVVNVPSNGSGFQLANFTISANGTESVLLKSFLFTLRNQATSGTGSAATVTNYRTMIGGTTYTSSSTVDGIYTDNHVALGSGITIPQGSSLNVSVLADIAPTAPGTLDLWVYPEDMQFVGVTSGTAIVATSSVTNRVDTSLLYWSGWISTGSTSGGTNSLSATPIDAASCAFCSDKTSARMYRFDVTIDPSSYSGVGAAGDNAATPSGGFTQTHNVRGWGLSSPYQLQTGDGTTYNIFGDCALVNGGYSWDGSSTLTSCTIAHAYAYRGVYTARLVNKNLICGIGATSCPGYVVSTVVINAL